MSFALERELEAARRDFRAVEARLAVMEAGAAGQDTLQALAKLRAELESRAAAEIAVEVAKRTREAEDRAARAEGRAYEAWRRMRVVEAGAKDRAEIRASTIAAVVSAELRKVADAVECSALAGSPIEAARCLRGMAARWQRSGSSPGDAEQ